MASDGAVYYFRPAEGDSPTPGHTRTDVLKRWAPTGYSGVIDDAVSVFEGHFEIPLASALGHAQQATVLLEGRQPGAALAEAQAAVDLAPDSVTTQVALGDALTALNRPDEARPAYQRALELATTVEPEFQVSWIPTLEAKLASK